MYDWLLAKAAAREGGAQKHVRAIRMGKLPFPRTPWERSMKRMRSAEAIAQIVCSRGQPTLTINSRPRRDYSFTTSICLSITRPVNRSIAARTQYRCSPSIKTCSLTLVPVSGITQISLGARSFKSQGRQQGNRSSINSQLPIRRSLG